MTLAQKTLLASSRAIGMTEKRDRARVMMPMVMPPVRSVTQQQHRFRHGIAVVTRHTCSSRHEMTLFVHSCKVQLGSSLVARESTSLSKDCSPMAARSFKHSHSHTHAHTHSSHAQTLSLYACRHTHTHSTPTLKIFPDSCCNKIEL